jgi:uncharacterized repeat protein (TIGR02543 family)
MEDPIPTYTLTSTVSPAEAGKITASPSASTYPEGSQVTLTAEPNENWVFKQWEGDQSSTTNPVQVTMTSKKTLVAVFVKRDYPLTIKIEGEGTVEEKIVTNPSGREYPHGTTVELTPKPKEGWEFDGWAGDLTGKEIPKRIIVDKEKNVTVKFKRRDYLLNLTISGEGIIEEKIISTPGGRTYPFQTVVQLTPKAKEGWEFESWGGDLSGKETPKSIIIEKEKNVIAKFKSLLLSTKLEKTVWEGNENYSVCDCGFSAIVGFKGGQIYELSDGPSKVPTGCLPNNFWVRDYNGEIKNYKDEESKISFTIVSGSDWVFLTEIEIVVGKLKITTTWSNGYKVFQEYNPSTIKIEDYCK